MRGKDKLVGNPRQCKGEKSEYATEGFSLVENEWL